MRHVRTCHDHCKYFLISGVKGESGKCLQFARLIDVYISYKSRHNFHPSFSFLPYFTSFHPWVKNSDSQSVYSLPSSVETTSPVKEKSFSSMNPISLFSLSVCLLFSLTSGTPAQSKNIKTLRVIKAYIKALPFDYEDRYRADWTVKVAYIWCMIEEDREREFILGYHAVNDLIGSRVETVGILSRSSSPFLFSSCLKWDQQKAQKEN